MQSDQAEHPARLHVGVISAGKVGTALASALANAGHHIAAVCAISARSKARARQHFPDAQICPAPDVIAVSELVLLALPIDILPGLVAGLAQCQAWRPGQLVVHTAARYGCEVLTPASDAGAHPIALHPAMTFTGTDADVARLTDCCIAVTAPAQLEPVGMALAMDMGAEPIVVPPQRRAQYAAALAHGSDHLVTLVAQALAALREAQVAHADRVLAPMLSAALDHVLRSGDAALSGSAALGDAESVAVQLASLPAESRPAYRALARASADRAIAAGQLAAGDADRLLAILAEPSPPRP